MVREPTSSEIRSRNKLVEPEQERSMDRSSILRASTNCSVGEHIRVFVVRRAFVLLVR